MSFYKTIILGCFLLLQACTLNSQTDNMDDKQKNKGISCDINTGKCQPSEEGKIEEINMNILEKIQLIYYTDPICSACWAIEPELKKLKLEYGEYLDISYKMGGLLPNWEVFGRAGGAISKPSDVAHHWDEVGEHRGMSIDGDIWLEDPLDSSYPPSIAFKAVQKQGEDLARRFLRNIREQLFLENKNINREELLVKAVKEEGGDAEQFVKDYHDKATEQSFYDEMNQGRTYGVRGFPTFIFVGKDGKGFKMSGTSGYKNYVSALEQALGKKVVPRPVNMTALDLLKKYGYLGTREIEVVLSQDKKTTLNQLGKLEAEGLVVREKQKFGDFWRVK